MKLKNARNSGFGSKAAAITSLPSHKPEGYLHCCLLFLFSFEQLDGMAKEKKKKKVGSPN